MSRATEVLDKLISRLKYLRSRVDNDDKKMINDDLAEVGLHKFKLTIVTNTSKVEDKIPGSTKPPEQRAREESTSSEEDEIVPTPGSTKPPGKRARKNSTPSEDEIVPTPNSIKASGKRARKDSSFSEDVVADPKASRKRARKDLTSSEDVVADLKALVAANAPASVGSNGSMDLLDKDLPLNRTSGETSFVGQNSEVNILMSGEAHVQDDIADPLAEDEADIDRRPSLLAYPGATLALQSGNVVPMPGPSLSTYPGPTLSLGYENVFAMPDPNLSPGQFQFPITYDDSFLTNFDQQSSIPLTMDESWRNAGGDSLQYSQGQQYQPQSHYYQS